EGGRLRRHRNVGARRLAQVHADAGLRLRRKADAARGDGVGSADLEALNEILAVGAGQRAGAISGERVEDLDLNAFDWLALLVRYDTTDRARGGALGGQRRSAAKQCRD